MTFVLFLIMHLLIVLKLVIYEIKKRFGNDFCYDFPVSEFIVLQQSENNFKV